MFVFTMALTQSVLCEKQRFYTNCHISGPKRSPEMIFNAFDVKFQAWKNGIPLRAYRPLTRTNKKKKTNHKMH